MNFDPTSLSNFMLILAAWGGAFIAALWLSLVIWTYRDIRSRARDLPTRILAVLVVAVLFLPGIVIYLILRPPRTLVEEYQNTLEEEALLQSIEEAALCPGCGRRIKEDWRVCPNCHTKIKKTCHKCGRLMELPWNLCPFCETPAPGMRRENLTLDDVLSTLPPIEVEEPTAQLEDETLPEPQPEAEIPEPESAEGDIAVEAIPEVEAAEVSLPGFDLSEVDSVEAEAPQADTPEIAAPDFDSPEVEEPQVSPSVLDAPEVEPSQVDAPDTGEYE
jgi:RNA polymerase subunit RPABC4/transcription elongation factor Spt4